MAIVDWDSEEEDLEKMESDVKDLALKVSDYRKSLADNLKNILQFLLIDPIVITSIQNQKNPLCLDLEPVEEQESPGRYVQLKETVWENVATMPLVMKRMRECKETIDKANSLNGTIHPAFTRRKAN